MIKLTPEDKAKIDKLVAMGKAPKQIQDIIQFPKYFTVYKYIHRFEIAAEARKRYHQKPENKLKSKRDRGATNQCNPAPARELLPINPPGPVTKIHADPTIINMGLLAQYGKKLQPITATMAERKPPIYFRCDL